MRKIRDSVDSLFMAMDAQVAGRVQDQILAAFRAPRVLRDDLRIRKRLHARKDDL